MQLLNSYSQEAINKKSINYQTAKIDILKKNAYIQMVLQLQIDAVILVECYVYFRVIDLVESYLIMSLQSYNCYRVIFKDN